MIPKRAAPQPIFALSRAQKATFFAAFLVGMFLLFGAGKLFENNPAGFIKVRQMPISGALDFYSRPGWFPQLFGMVTEYRQAGTYAFSADPDVDGITLNSDAVQVRFNDGGLADISGSVRFDLPLDSERLERIHLKFRSYEALAQGMIMPAIQEALVLTGSLMSAEESYSGRRSEFAQMAWDQLTNGAYMTETVESQVTDETGNKYIKRSVQIRKDKSGDPIRKANPLSGYGVSLSQFYLHKDFAYEPGVLKQIERQRESLMQTVAAKAQATKAEQDRLTAEAQGQADVMKAKYEEEVEKEKAIVIAQRQKEVAELEAAQKLEVAKLAKQEAEEYKQQQILIGEGDAKRKKLVMEADGALQQKLDAWRDSQKYWAEAYAQRAVPSQVFNSGSDAGAGGPTAGTDLEMQRFMQLMTVKAAKDLSLEFGIQNQNNPAKP